MLVKGKTGVNQGLDLVEGKDNPSTNFTKSKSDLKSDFIIKRKKKINDPAETLEPICHDLINHAWPPLKK